MEARQRRLAVLLAIAVLPITVLLLYLPVHTAWSTRTPGMVFGGPAEAGLEFTTVERNWFVRSVPFLYEPLLRFHAGLSGWGFHAQVEKTAFPHPPSVALVFSRPKPAEPVQPTGRSSTR